jgi:hypothetical protein
MLEETRGDTPPQGENSVDTGAPLWEKKTLALVVLVLSTVVFGALSIPATICSFTSLVTANFQQQRLIEVVEVYFLVCYFLSLPLVIIGSLVTAWVKYSRKVYRVAILLGLLPVAYIVFYLIVEFLFDYVLKSLPFL